MRSSSVLVLLFLALFTTCISEKFLRLHTQKEGHEKVKHTLMDNSKRHPMTEGSNIPNRLLHKKRNAKMTPLENSNAAQNTTKELQQKSNPDDPKLTKKSTFDSSQGKEGSPLGQLNSQQPSSLIMTVVPNSTFISHYLSSVSSSSREMTKRAAASQTSLDETLPSTVQSTSPLKATFIMDKPTTSLLPSMNLSRTATTNTAHVFVTTEFARATSTLSTTSTTRAGRTWTSSNSTVLMKTIDEPTTSQTMINETITTTPPFSPITAPTLPPSLVITTTPQSSSSTILLPSTSIATTSELLPMNITQNPTSAIPHFISETSTANSMSPAVTTSLGSLTESMSAVTTGFTSTTTTMVLAENSTLRITSSPANSTVPITSKMSPVFITTNTTNVDTTSTSALVSSAVITPLIIVESTTGSSITSRSSSTYTFSTTSTTITTSSTTEIPTTAAVNITEMVTETTISEPIISLGSSLPPFPPPPLFQSSHKPNPSNVVSTLIHEITVQQDITPGSDEITEHETIINSKPTIAATIPIEIPSVTDSLKQKDGEYENNDKVNPAAVVIPILIVVGLITSAVMIVVLIRWKKSKNRKKNKSIENGSAKKKVDSKQSTKQAGYTESTTSGSVLSPKLGIKKQFLQPLKKKNKQLPPRQVQPAIVDEEHHQFMGPLTIDAELKGPVRHGTEKAPKSHSLKDVVFDNQMNKVYDIGSDVEILEKTDSESKTLYVDDDNTLVASQQLIFSEKGVRRRQSPAPAADGSQLMKNSKKEK